MINKIKIFRKNLNFTQEELAKKLHVTRQTINAIENNKYNPTLELAMKLARILNTTVEELFEVDYEN
jgi:putative transcriptional regulator